MLYTPTFKRIGIWKGDYSFTSNGSFYKILVSMLNTKLVIPKYNSQAITITYYPFPFLQKQSMGLGIHYLISISNCHQTSCLLFWEHCFPKIAGDSVSLAQISPVCATTLYCLTNPILKLPRPSLHWIDEI